MNSTYEMNPWTTPVVVAVSHEDYFHAIVYAHPGDRFGLPEVNKYVAIGKLSRAELRDLVDQKILELTYEDSFYHPLDDSYPRGTRVLLLSNEEYRPEQFAASLEYLYYLSHTNLTEGLAWK